MNLDDLKVISNTVEKKAAVNNCILLIKSGSSLYGTKTNNSDEDAIGVFIEPEEYRFGRKTMDTVEFKTNSSSSGIRNKKGDLDITLYSLDKFIGLAENNNPTICELFFPPKNCLIHSSEIGDDFLESYSLFISKKLYHSHCGYAYSQINRNEVKSGRNSGRIELIEKFGYDCKLMSHAIRLYIEAIELLGTGEIVFPLKENQKLIDIKNGLWSYEKCQEECKRLELLAGQVYASSSIRHSPDRDNIDSLQIKLYKRFYGYTS